MRAEQKKPPKNQQKHEKVEASRVLEIFWKCFHKKSAFISFGTLPKNFHIFSVQMSMIKLKELFLLHIGGFSLFLSS